MKRSIFGLLLISILLSSCNDDDENNNPLGGVDPMQPTSGSISATINGESLNTTSNVARELSYGDFMIRSEAEGKSLKFVLNEFLGNATYTLTNLPDQNSVEYFTEINGESVGFESISGELNVENFDPTTDSFDATFNITFARVGNSSITMTGEGSYSGLTISEIQEPEIGGITVFYNEQEYFSFEDSITRFSNEVITFKFTESEFDQLIIEGTLPNGNPDQVIVSIQGESIELNGSELLVYSVDTVNDLISGRFKNINSDQDFEMWFEQLPYITDENEFTPAAQFTYGDTLFILESPLFVQNFIDGTNGVQFIFAAGNFDVNLIFEMPFSTLDTSLNQTVGGLASFDFSPNPDLEFEFEEAIMTFQEATIENTVDVMITIPGIGTVQALSVPIQE